MSLPKGEDMWPRCAIMANKEITNELEAREMFVQAGAYAEHTIRVAKVGKTTVTPMGATLLPYDCVNETESVPWPQRPSALFSTSYMSICPSEAVPFSVIWDIFELSSKWWCMVSISTELPSGNSVLGTWKSLFVRT